MNPQKKMAVRWLTLEFAGKTLTFAVLKLRLLRRRETEASFCLYNFLRFYYVKWQAWYIIGWRIKNVWA